MSKISIKIGEQGTAFAQRYPALVKIQHQPAGVNFYDVDWKQATPGSVTIEHGKYSFVIENVMSVMAGQDLGDEANEGLTEFSINAGITAPDRIPHDEARLKMYAILQQIVQAGWQMNITRSMPRLRGKDALDYQLVDDYTSLDASYVPTFEEWMKIDSRTDWRFYADHIFLTVNFTRESSLTDPTKPGAYLISFNLKSENEFYRGYVGGEHRKEWKARLPAELAKLAPLRAAAEAKLRAQGVKIDETYQDPPLPDLRSN
ncbi:hypothetical protein [Sulfurirhabdus autotrophica]|uniref:Uncharacterized protein n=1 Tax=Sulfurirhabdus autotrophica TaxID=1706046 RepID=A0A4R3YEZ1_9PROT|nr:hypothetical protein [Sulfurirhabdus autotrophica]TCV90686.1 hypothetical protein EDC63_101660 [Sulfurirhabdus autotrophica]